jgi:hypothetical protein
MTVSLAQRTSLRLATPEERAARIATSDWYKRLWRHGVRTREEAYEWLRASKPHLPKSIDAMSVGECAELTAAIRAQLNTDLRMHFKGLGPATHTKRFVRRKAAAS